MISAFANTWKVAELRERILFTLLMIVIIRLGVHVALPGVDTTSISRMMEDTSAARGGQGIVGAMVGMFSGGGLQQLGIFALGIMPYISASILTQLMTAVVPKVARLSKEDGGRQKINQYTRFITILIALVQGYLLVAAFRGNDAALLTNIPGFQNYNPDIHGLIVPDPGFFTFVIPALISIIAGTLLLMWIGDQMTEAGIGNGTSIIITVNIISAFPGAISLAWSQFVLQDSGGAGALKMVAMVAFFLLVIAAVIAITEAQRRIAVSYAKRMVGRKQMGGQTQYLPLKINYAGVMPIIFASALLSLPVFFVRLIPGIDGASVDWWTTFMSPYSWFYYFISTLMIFGFAFFWVATMFQPKQIAEDLKRNGGYIPGVRPGEPTSKFLDFTMSRLTFAGAIFLAIVFILPAIFSTAANVPGLAAQFLGGTSLLIMVGVLLDVMRQVETHLLSQQYDGFFKSGKGAKRPQKYGVGTVAAPKTENNVGILFIIILAISILAVISFVTNG